MKIPQSLPQFEREKALVVVAAKERGKIYSIHAGSAEQLGEVIEPAATYSDREGFFMRTAHGQQLGSGFPYERDEAAQRQRFTTALADEINTAVADTQPDTLYIFEPRHYAGAVATTIAQKDAPSPKVVRYGNYVDASPRTLIEYIAEAAEQPHNPADPDSVGSKLNAREIRSILEVGERRRGI